MWTCPACGERHQDQFDACWKCAGQQMPRVPPAEPGTPRTLLDVLPSAALCGLGAGVGAVACFAWVGQPWPETLIGALAVAAVVTALVAGFRWALFPHLAAPNDEGPA